VQTLPAHFSSEEALPHPAATTASAADRARARAKRLTEGGFSTVTNRGVKARAVARDQRGGGRRIELPVRAR
jgi:hypothetical protein